MWPSRSSDLNTIENLWDFVSKSMTWGRPVTRRQLIKQYSVLWLPSPMYASSETISQCPDARILSFMQWVNPLSAELWYWVSLKMLFKFFRWSVVNMDLSYAMCAQLCNIYFPRYFIEYITCRQGATFFLSILCSLIWVSLHFQVYTMKIDIRTDNKIWLTELLILCPKHLTANHHCFM